MPFLENSDHFLNRKLSMKRIRIILTEILQVFRESMKRQYLKKTVHPLCTGLGTDNRKREKNAHENYKGTNI